MCSGFAFEQLHQYAEEIVVGQNAHQFLPLKHRQGAVLAVPQRAGGLLQRRRAVVMRFSIMIYKTSVDSMTSVNCS